MATQPLAVAVERLYNECRDSGHCHVLLDPQAGSTFDEAISALSEEVAPRAHLKDPMFVDAAREAPLLVRLPLNEWGLVEALAARAQEEATDFDNSLRSVCGFIRSSAPFSLLASQLGRALNLEAQGGGVYFRYFDPRVIHHLPHLLPAATRGQLLRGVETWSYFSWDGDLVVQEVPASNPSSARHTRITAAERGALESIEHFNATQRLFASRDLPFERARTTELFGEVRAVRALGLSSPEDTAHFLACSRLATRPLSQHAAWPQVLTLVSQGAPLSEALAHHCGVSLPTA